MRASTWSKTRGYFYFGEEFGKGDSGSQKGPRILCYERRQRKETTPQGQVTKNRLKTNGREGGTNVMEVVRGRSLCRAGPRGLINSGGAEVVVASGAIRRGRDHLEAPFSNTIGGSSFKEPDQGGGPRRRLIC